METKQEGNGEELDLYWEHPMHFKFTEHCSECFKMSSVDFTNKKQENNLSKLRASIEAQKQARKEIVSAFEDVNKKVPMLELKNVPEITIEDKTEFDIVRHEQLCDRVNVLYHNYLYRKQEWRSDDHLKQMDFENSLQDLSRGYDDLLEEGLKVRFN